MFICDSWINLVWFFKQSAASSLDGIIDTVSATHPIAPLLSVLKPHGKLVLVGAPEKPLEIAAFSLIMGKHLIIFFFKHCLFL